MLAWQPDYGNDPAPGETPMQLVGPAQYWATLPLRRDEVIHYSATVQFKDGSLMTLPDNLADALLPAVPGQDRPALLHRLRDRSVR